MVATAAAATTTTTTTPGTTMAAATTVPGGRLASDLLLAIPVQREEQAGYHRSLFPTWLDLDGNACDTRQDVLARDSVVPVTRTGCGVVGGQWVSPYDSKLLTAPGLVDIDHVVPLKEAWDSGAFAWSAERRAAFANDLTDARTLKAASAASNQEKGDADPSNWMPVDRAAWCPYLASWLSIKARWSLAMDESEYGRIGKLLATDCVGLTVSPWPGLPPTALVPPAATAPPPSSMAPPVTPTVPTDPSPTGPVPPISEYDCPDWAPIKGNDNSGIYHRPGQQAYNRTKPEACFATSAAAEVAGYRAAKR